MHCHTNINLGRLHNEKPDTDFCIDRHTRRSCGPRFGRADLKSIDGLFCATDLMAIGALDGLRTDLGRNVPKDIQVLGYDDIEQAAWVAYNLSTIRQNIEAQAEAVIRLLSDRLLDSSLPIRVHNQELTPVLRGTTRHDS